MKIKILSFVLFAACLSFSVFAEDWTCSECDLPMNGNFCSNCGGARDKVKKVSGDAGADAAGKNVKDSDSSAGIETKEFNILSVAEASAHKSETIKFSEDKHLYYIKDYVGKTVSNIGYYSIGGERLDKYGNATLKMNLITLDGEYVALDDNNLLSQYIVVAQSVEPNTELKITFDKDSQGNEYYFPKSKNIDAVDLIVVPKSGDVSNDKIGHIPAITKISPNKYLFYIKDYVGRNLGTIGYSSIGGDRLEKYGDSTVEFNFITEDGSYIPIDDESILKKYYVKAQSVEPNTELKLFYGKDLSGNESSYVDRQTVEAIDLWIAPLDGVWANKKLDHIPEKTKLSKDKYLYYIKDYVGRNLGTIGYSSFGGDRLEKYGDSTVEFNFITEDGSYIPVDDKSILKKYYVKAQSVEPDTELKLFYGTDLSGNESSYVDRQTVKEIDLWLAPLDGVWANKKLDHIPVKTKPSKDKYSYYIKDYVGRNLGTVGYSSFSGDRLEKYGDSTVEFNFITEDGSYIPIDDESILKKYYVKAQSVEPDTELKLFYGTDFYGNESSYIERQTVEAIDLWLAPLDGVLQNPKLDHIPEKAKFSGDKHLLYIKDYVGRNLATFGYNTWGGERFDKYGNGNVKIIIEAENGEKVPVDENKVLRQYVVYDQSVPVNSELKIVFDTDYSGKESETSVLKQSVEEIVLKVRKIQ